MWKSIMSINFVLFIVKVGRQRKMCSWKCAMHFNLNVLIEFTSARIQLLFPLNPINKWVFRKVKHQRRQNEGLFYLFFSSHCEFIKSSSSKGKNLKNSVHYPTCLKWEMKVWLLAVLSTALKMFQSRKEFKQYNIIMRVKILLN